ncbi:DUF5712 family protein [Hymenobacter humi]|uniref:DUF5712 family protein n=1 Tax=Hymenobacter humi TaxID=1411620 RepID=A0ABW2UEB3_9BACT
MGASFYTRPYRGTDAAVRAGAAGTGQARPARGSTYVHVVVSARDRKQRITLNPGGRVSRISLSNWQEQARQVFEW